MQPLRDRIRALVIAVAVVAFLVWGSMIGMRSYEDYRLAESWAQEHSPEPPPADFPSP